MNWARIIALTMVGEDVILAFAYLLQRDVRMFVYWMAAAVITASVSW